MNKFLLVLLAGFTSAGYSQFLFNRITGTDPYLVSARSFALGQTTYSENSTRLLLINPAGLWRLGDGFSSEYHLGGNIGLERRGFDLKDFFGDYLTTSDYVVNHTNRSFSGLGISGSRTYGTTQVSAALSVDPLTSFAYKYVEEIRGKESCDDGIICNKDPLLGYHRLETRGQLDRFSFGLGIRYKLDDRFTLNWGIAYHKIPESSVHDIFMADTLQIMDGYMGEIHPADRVENTPGDGFFSYGFELNTWKGLHFSFAFDPKLIIESDFNTPSVLDSSSGLPLFIAGDTLSFQIEGVHYVKPSRLSLGVAYTTHGTTPILVTVDYTVIDSYSLKLVNNEIFHMLRSASWHLGLEYMTTSQIPVRVGLVFKQSPFQVLDPQTVFTVGSSKSFGDLQVDFAAGFQSTQYNYPDLFPVEDDVRPSLDTVSESLFNFMFSFKYNL